MWNGKYIFLKLKIIGPTITLHNQHTGLRPDNSSVLKGEFMKLKQTVDCGQAAHSFPVLITEQKIMPYLLRKMSYAEPVESGLGILHMENKKIWCVNVIFRVKAGNVSRI